VSSEQHLDAIAAKDRSRGLTEAGGNAGPCHGHGAGSQASDRDKFAESEPLAREALEGEKKVSPMTGGDSAPTASWARASRERRNTPRPNRCCSKATRACWLARAASQLLIASTWNWRINGSSSSTRPGANPTKPRGGRRSRRSQDAGAGTSAVLQVPSAILPAERKFLLNPRHPDFPRLVIGSPCLAR